MTYRTVTPHVEGVRKISFVPHDRFLEKDDGGDARFTGVLRFRLEASESNPFFVGAGRLEPEGNELVQETVRRPGDGAPLIPGSSLKGAIRQTYEALTPSCPPATHEGCRVLPREEEPRVCPACSLFGAPGYGGRLSVGEARPRTDARAGIRKVPTAWAPRKDHAGSYKYYDQKKAIQPLSGTPAQEVEPVRCCWGTFDLKVRFVNASEQEMGFFLAAIGCTGALHLSSPHLRVGGKKFHGFGSLAVALEEVNQRFPELKRIEGVDAEYWAMEILAKQVLADEDAKATFFAIREALGENEVEE